MKAHIIDFINQDLLNGQAVISEEDELLLSGLIDSLGIMRLVAHIEQEHQVKIPPEDITIENFSTVSAITAYAKGKLNAY